MRIIFVSKNRYNEEVISNNLKELSEQDSIAFLYSYSEAEDFINNHIIKKQVPLDLIITENNIDEQRAHEFYAAITTDLDRTYSNYDFKFCEIPTILIVDKNENKTAYSKHGFSNVIDNISLDKLNLLTSEFRCAVKTWRKNVLNELDNIGIKFNSGSIDYSYIFSNERKKEIVTKILSENFMRFPRKLNYAWLITNEVQIEKAIDEFIKELKRASRLNKKNEEKRFHKLFNEYPFLLRRDNYDKHWYQPRLFYNETEYYEPDYGLQPNFNQKTDLSIIEVKLPNEAFIKKKNFHPSPYNKIIEHLFQVNDYKDYLESDEYHEAIKKAFGFVPDSIEYNILVGRADDKLNSLKIFNNRMRQIKADHINFITYDDLLDYQVKFLDRVKLLNII